MRTMKRMILSCLALLSGLALSTPVTAQEGEDGPRSLRWSELTVRAHLDATGRLLVRERQGMVFDGAWNGGERDFDVRLGQHLRWKGIDRVDRATGARVPLLAVEEDDENGPERVDEYGWADGDRVRWRSRAESDPPFRQQEIVYELGYALWPVLSPAEDGGYLLRHDFAFPDRDGVIERFHLTLRLDPAWSAPDGRELTFDAAQLQPGRGYTVELPLRFLASGEPIAAPPPAPPRVRTTLAAASLLGPLLVLLALWMQERRLNRIAPPTPPDRINAAWLRTHIFAHPPEIVGAAWDRSVESAEVAALLARLVAEGKLSSHVEAGEDGEPVLHLQRHRPISEFAPQEQPLLEDLFFGGREETDTAAIREHFQKQGFDPAERIRKCLMERLAELPGEGKVRRNWIPALLVAAAGLGGVLFLPDSPGRAPVVLVGLVIAAAFAIVALLLAAFLANRVVHRRALTLSIGFVLLLPAVLLAMLAAGAFDGDGGFVFYRPGGWLLLGFAVLLAGIGLAVITLARPPGTAERLAFRRRLASARAFFELELDRPEPRLHDAWFPYLLAFGLGGHIDRWFRAFGGEQRRADAHLSTTGVALAASGGQVAGSASPGSGWTGGGPQFGGGSFAGGGAGRTWGVAAAGIAAGVAAPSSSGGGGGVAVSGGGGGGGW